MRDNLFKPIGELLELHCARISACCPTNMTPAKTRLVGNFPQAISHVSLISTAHNLSHAEPA